MRKKERVRALRAYDLAMRADGFVTASEVADAMGVTLATVHKAIRSEKIPGREINGIGGDLKRWFVDIRKMLADFPEDGPSSVKQELTKLAGLVPTSQPKKKAAGAR